MRQDIDYESIAEQEQWELKYDYWDLVADEWHDRRDSLVSDVDRELRKFYDYNNVKAPNDHSQIVNQVSSLMLETRDPFQYNKETILETLAKVFLDRHNQCI